MRIEINPQKDIDEANLAIAPLEEKAQTLAVIETAEQYESAAVAIAEAKRYRRDIEGKLKAITKPINDGLKNVRALFAPVLGRLSDFEGSIDRAMSTYRREQEKERQRLEAIARDKARKDRERLEAKAEKEEEKGNANKAQQLREAAIATPAPVIIPQTPKVEGQHTREKWNFRIVNESKLPREYMSPDLKKIGGVVRSMKGDTQIAGVEVWREETLVVKS